jgi:hypothetical protein
MKHFVDGLLSLIEIPARLIGDYWNFLALHTPPQSLLLVFNFFS